MDNTKANRKSMAELEHEFPWMSNLGCSAHNLALLIKDLGNAGSRKTKVGAVLEKAKMMGNAIGDSEKMRALVQKHMKAEMGTVRCWAVLGWASRPQCTGCAGLGCIVLGCAGSVHLPHCTGCAGLCWAVSASASVYWLCWAVLGSLGLYWECASASLYWLGRL
jgi:hypothetical protein